MNNKDIKILGFESKFTSITYFLFMENGVYIVDPAIDIEKIKEIVGDNKVMGVLLTHGHVDHIYSLEEVYDYYKMPVYCHEKCLEIMRPCYNGCALFGISKEVKIDKNAYIFIDEGDEIEGISIMLTPGHSFDSVTYVIDNYYFPGDLIFKGSIGRWDLYGGSLLTLRKSLNKFMIQDDGNRREGIIYPGHGVKTTFSDEFKTNEYIKKIVLKEGR